MQLHPRTAKDEISGGNFLKISKTLVIKGVSPPSPPTDKGSRPGRGTATPDTSSMDTCSQQRQGVGLKSQALVPNGREG